MLETALLLLRPWEEADAESLYKYAKSPQIGPAAGWPMHKSVADSREIIKTVFAVPETYAVVLKETGEPVGSIGLMFGEQSHLPLKEDEAELGYWIGVPFWGRGLIPEAARELLRHGFETLGLRAAWCAYFAENEKSRRVVEKCGFQYQYTLENVVVAENDVRTEHVTCITVERWKRFIACTVTDGESKVPEPVCMEKKPGTGHTEACIDEAQKSFGESFAQGGFWTSDEG